MLFNIPHHQYSQIANFTDSGRAGAKFSKFCPPTFSKSKPVRAARRPRCIFHLDRCGSSHCCKLTQSPSMNVLLFLFFFIMETLKKCETFVSAFFTSSGLTVCWSSSSDCSHGKAPQVRKRRHFWKPALNVFCVAKLQRHRFPLSNSEGWCWCGQRTYTCHVQEWMPTPEWLHCLLLMPHYLSSNTIATDTRNPDPEHVSVVLWGHLQYHGFVTSW